MSELPGFSCPLSVRAAFPQEMLLRVTSFVFSVPGHCWCRPLPFRLSPLRIECQTPVRQVCARLLDTSSQRTGVVNKKNEFLATCLSHIHTQEYTHTGWQTHSCSTPKPPPMTGSACCCSRPYLFYRAGTKTPVRQRKSSALLTAAQPTRTYHRLSIQRCEPCSAGYKL